MADHSLGRPRDVSGLPPADVSVSGPPQVDVPGLSSSSSAIPGPAGAVKVKSSRVRRGKGLLLEKLKRVPKSYAAAAKNGRAQSLPHLLCIHQGTEECSFIDKNPFLGSLMPLRR